MEALDFALVQVLSEPARIELREVARLVGVDVSQSRNTLLVKQHVPQRCPGAVEQSGERAAAELPGEGFDPQARVERRPAGWIEDPHAAKATDVVEAEDTAALRAVEQQAD